MTRRSNRKYKDEGSEPEPIFSNDQPVAATIGGLVIVVLFFYFSWLAIDRFIELINAFSAGHIETHHSATRSHKFWTEKSNWYDRPWKFIFSITWVTAEMIALALLSYGCINALQNLTAEGTTKKGRQ